MGLKMAAAVLAAGLLALWGQRPWNNTPAYSACEVVFELGEKDAAAHPHPYSTVDVNVEFRSPRHHTYALPGYWDGGRRMAVRFSPTEAGDWDYHVTSNIAEWNDKTATISAAASEAPGFIRPANMHHWEYTEKDSAGLDRPHLWMGATEIGLAFLDAPGSEGRRGRAACRDRG